LNYFVFEKFNLVLKGIPINNAYSFSSKRIVLARAVFEQPPSSTRRDSAKYPVRKRKRQRHRRFLTHQRDIASFGVQEPLSCGGRHLRCVSKTWVDVTCGFAKTHFLSHKIHRGVALLSPIFPRFRSQTRTHLFRFMAGRTGRKQGTYMWGDPVFSANMSHYIRKYIEFVKQHCISHDPVFFARESPRINFRDYLIINEQVTVCTPLFDY